VSAQFVPGTFSLTPSSLPESLPARSMMRAQRKLFHNCFSGQMRQGSVNDSMLTMIHALWEFSPFIAGLVCGLLTSSRNRLQQRALIIKANLAIGTVFAYGAGELAGTSLSAIVSIIVDSSAVAAGLIVAHVVVKRFAVLSGHSCQRPNLRRINAGSY
jgi:hypothetical protein